LIYIRTLCPTVGPFDSGELISAAYVLGIPHAPGYPLYVLLGKLFTFLPFGNIAYRVNLMSAFFAALTVMLVFLIVWKLQASDTSETINQKSMAQLLNLLPAIVAALMLAFSPVFWRYALVAEVLTLNVFLAALMVYVLIIWHEKIATFRAKNPVQNSVVKPAIYLNLFAFLFGLSLGNHHSIILCLPAFLYFIWRAVRAGKSASETVKIMSTSQYLTMSVFFLIGLSVYIYLPLRSLQNPVIDSGNPENLKNFIKVFLRSEYGTFTLSRLESVSSFSIGLSIFQIFDFLRSLVKNFGFLGFAVGLLGCLEYSRKRVPLSWFLLLMFLFSGIGFVLLSNVPKDCLMRRYVLEKFYILPWLIFSIWIGVCTKSVLYRLRVKYLVYFVGGIFIILPFNLLRANYSRLNENCNYYTYHYGQDLLRTLEPNAIFIVSDDTALFTLCYLRYVEGLREDVRLIPTHRPVWSDCQEIKKKWPEIVPPGEKNFGETFVMDIIKYNIDTYPIYVLNPYFLPGVFPFNHTPQGLVKRVKRGAIYNLPVSRENYLQEIKSKDFFKLYEIGDERAYNASFKSPRASFIISRYAEAHNDIAVAYNYLSEFEEAIKECKKALEIKPDFAEAFNNLGSIYFRKNSIDDAIWSFKKAIQYKPDYAEAHNNLGSAYGRVGQNRLAMAEFNEAVRIRPDYADAHFNLGLGLGMLEGQYDKAILELETVIKLHPNSEYREEIERWIKNFKIKKKEVPKSP
jgi:tetratricopeptide (TPR) repeat protein